MQRSFTEKKGRGDDNCKWNNHNLRCQKVLETGKERRKKIQWKIRVNKTPTNE